MLQIWSSKTVGGILWGKEGVIERLNPEISRHFPFSVKEKHSYEDPLCIKSKLSKIHHCQQVHWKINQGEINREVQFF